MSSKQDIVVQDSIFHCREFRKNALCSPVAPLTQSTELTLDFR